MMLPKLEALKAELKDGVLFVVISSPPMNLIGPEFVRDLVDLINFLKGTEEVRVVVFKSADPDFFIPHVDVKKVPEYTKETARGTGVRSKS